MFSKGGCKAGRGRGMEDTSDSTFIGIDIQTCPFTVNKELFELALQSEGTRAEEEQVISKGGRGLGGRARVRELCFSSNTRRGVSVTTNREPPEEGFKEDKKD